MKGLLLVACFSAARCEPIGLEVKQSLPNLSSAIPAVACPELAPAVEAATLALPVVQSLAQQAKKVHGLNAALFEHDRYLLDHLFNDLKTEIAVHDKDGALTCEDARRIHELCNRLNQTKDGIDSLIKADEEHSTYWFRSKFAESERQMVANVTRDYEQFKESLILLETELSSKIMQHEYTEINALVNASRQQQLMENQSRASANNTVQKVETPLQQGVVVSRVEDPASTNATKEAIERMEREVANATNDMEKAIAKVNSRMVEDQPSRLYTMLWICVFLILMWLAWNWYNAQKMIRDPKHAAWYGAV